MLTNTIFIASNCSIMEDPYIIKFGNLGNDKIGFLSIAEDNISIPFDVKRVFWAHHIPDGVTRGYHAHKLTKQVLICMQGKIEIETTQKNGDKHFFELTSPDCGLYLPPTSWHKMLYTDTAIQLVLASELYDENDYIRDFDSFLKS